METLAEKTELMSVIEPLSVKEKRQPVTAAWNAAFSRHAQEFEKARFGWMAILLTFQSCLGAVACMFISMNSSDLVSLSVCAALTMGSNALFIALAPPKVCLLGFYLSVLINSVMILAIQL